MGSASTWATVACGDFFSLAPKTNDTLWPWGHNGLGQLGLGDTVNRTTPTKVNLASQ